MSYVLLNIGPSDQPTYHWSCYRIFKRDEESLEVRRHCKWTRCWGRNILVWKVKSRMWKHFSLWNVPSHFKRRGQSFPMEGDKLQKVSKAGRRVLYWLHCRAVEARHFSWKKIQTHVFLSSLCFSYHIPKEIFWSDDSIMFIRMMVFFLKYFVTLQWKVPGMWWICRDKLSKIYDANQLPYV